MGVFQNRGVCWQAFPPFPSPTPLLPLFCARLIFRAARMRKTSFARPQFRSRGAGTLATQASYSLLPTDDRYREHHDHIWIVLQFVE